MSKYPNINSQVSTPALLKANLQYLTTEHRESAEVKGLIEENPLFSSKKME